MGGVLYECTKCTNTVEGSGQVITIDYRSRVPIYDQIVNGIIRLKAAGVLKADDKLPSVRSLANDIHINPNTVQRAYAILESEGIIYSVSGKGSFISGDENAEAALHSAAVSDFKAAVKAALERGLDSAELTEIIKEEAL